MGIIKTSSKPRSFVQNGLSRNWKEMELGRCFLRNYIHLGAPSAIILRQVSLCKLLLPLLDCVKVKGTFFAYSILGRLEYD